MRNCLREPFLSCRLERHLVFALHFSRAVFYFKACQDFIGEVNAAHISKWYFMGAWENEMQPGGEQHCAGLQPPTELSCENPESVFCRFW